MIAILLTTYTTIFYQPLYNLLVFFYTVVPGHDLGVAIILLTVFVKLLLAPLSLRSIKSQRALQFLQPKLKLLQEQYKNNKEALARETMKMYRDEKVNPFSSCLPLLLQFPFLIAIYQVFQSGIFSPQFDLLYSFIIRPEAMQTIAFGFLDLTKTSTALAVAAGLAQWWQARMLTRSKPSVKTEGSKDEAMTAVMNRQMMYIMPAITVFIGLKLPSGLSLYWLLMTLLTVLQQYHSFRRDPAVKTPSSG